MRKHRHDMLKLAQKNKDSFTKDELYQLDEELTKMTNAAVKTITSDQERKTNEVSKSQ